MCARPNAVCGVDDQRRSVAGTRQPSTAEEFRRSRSIKGLTAACRISRVADAGEGLFVGYVSARVGASGRKLSGNAAKPWGAKYV